MKRFLKYISVAVVVSVLTGLGIGLLPQTAKAACGNGYLRCAVVTIKGHTVAAIGSNVTNYVSEVATSTQTSLATVGNGGEVQHPTTETGSSYTGSVPADLIFTSDSSCGSKLNWEIESYSASTGAIIAWVNIGTLHSASDDTIEMCWDNAAISTWQGNVNGTWDSNFAEVLHTPDGSTLSAVDSTSNTNNGTITGMVATAGQIDGGALTTGSQNIKTPSINLGTSFTVEGWGKNNTLTGYDRFAENGYTNGMYLGIHGANTTLYLFIVNGDLTVFGGTTDTTTWHYLVGTYDGTTARLYVDGVSVGTPSTPGNPTIGSAPVSWGQNINGNGESWNGKMDELRLSTTARSADYILASYNNEMTGSTMVTFGSEQAGGGGGGTTGTPAFIQFGLNQLSAIQA